MKAINETKTSEATSGKDFDALRQEFGDGNFYGLEYILDDFFEDTAVKPPVPAPPPVDWFGLYS